jgi:hypothetical protein
MNRGKVGQSGTSSWVRFGKNHFRVGASCHQLTLVDSTSITPMLECDPGQHFVNNFPPSVAHGNQVHIHFSMSSPKASGPKTAVLYHGCQISFRRSQLRLGEKFHEQIGDWQGQQIGFK